MDKIAFDKHAVHSTLDDLVKKLRDLESQKVEFFSWLPDPIAKIEHVIWSLQQSDYRLLSTRLMDDLLNKSNQCAQAIETIENLIVEVPEPADFSQRFEASKKSLDQRIGALMEQLSSPIARTFSRSEANEGIEDLANRASDAIAELKRLQDGQREALDNQIDTLKSELKKLEDKLKTEETRAQSLQQDLSEKKAALTTVADAKSKEFDDLISARTEQLNNWRDELNAEGDEYLDKIKEMYRLSADNTLSGRFFAAAQSERRSYFYTTGGAVLFFVGSIVAIIFQSFWGANLVHVSDEDPFFLWLSKLSLIAVFLAPAGYLASLASRHRKADIWYRTMGVRIATLKPYLAEFEDDANQYSEELKGILKSFFASEISSEEKQRSLFGRPHLPLRTVTRQLEEIKELVGWFK